MRAAGGCQAGTLHFAEQATSMPAGFAVGQKNFLIREDIGKDAEKQHHGGYISGFGCRSSK